MNNKGFTLIELLATICLLAVIAVISFVSINGIIKKSKVSDCENLLSSIKSGVKEYVSDNRYNNDFNVDNIKIENLNLSGSLINPFTGEELDDSQINIEVTLNSDYTVREVIVKNGSNLVLCDNEKW